MKHQPLSADLLIGVGPISEFVGMSPRQIFYRLQNQMLPGFKIGNLWCARRSTLENFIAEQEKRAARPPRKGKAA